MREGVVGAEVERQYPTPMFSESLTNKQAFYLSAAWRIVCNYYGSAELQYASLAQLARADLLTKCSEVSVFNILIFNL